MPTTNRVVRDVIPGKSRVTVVFELSESLDPQRFVEWLEAECNIAEDGDGAIKHEVEMVNPVFIEMHRPRGLRG